ncbi:hypothetical protein FOXG_07039 [Fusarium oxysporum f. sp. lycopersici 4287]|uniref:Uncharacterized protein n=2 Tax=Fusarium oxysporum TaxID=5507 RepID=A0A0J9V557_FUSO4|nr:hypothetical protein FOXG_07039 [Fusarium oxysporum f. sp. lycopersici 4287]KAJ9419673.1 hypothetical protein QL093DRAFT_2639360 [Fusarium oxysporum]KNB06273.1 hypothetical protein FOXG_07039 [Fusarium oxysporum f. sp. lycopersici 4287]
MCLKVRDDFLSGCLYAAAFSMLLVEDRAGLPPLRKDFPWWHYLHLSMEEIQKEPAALMHDIVLGFKGVNHRDGYSNPRNTSKAWSGPKPVPLGSFNSSFTALHNPTDFRYQ